MGMPKLELKGKEQIKPQTKWQDIEKPENMEEAKQVAEKNKEAIDKKEKAIEPKKKESFISKVGNALSDADKTLASSGIGSKGAEATISGKGEKGTEAIIRGDVAQPTVEEVKPELQDQLLNSDEGSVAQEAINSKSPAPLEKIVNPDTNEPFILPTYDQDGRVTALKPLIPKNAELYDKKVGIALTLISIALSGITGGMFPPINFIDIRWDDAKNRAAEMENEIINLYNEEIDLANKNLINTRGTEQNLESAQSNPELYNRENTDALARGKAAEQGNISLEQTEMNADLQKALQENGYNFDINKMKLNNEQQIKLTQLLYNQEVKKVFDQVKKMKEEGFSNDEIAKFISSMNGTTTLARGLGYAKDVTGMATDVANSVSNFVTSDKIVKTFNAPKANTNLLRKSFKWR